MGTVLPNEEDVDIVDCININLNIYWCYRPVRPIIFLNSNPNFYILVYIPMDKNEKDHLQSLYKYNFIEYKHKVIVKTKQIVSTRTLLGQIKPTVFNFKISNSNDDLNRSSTIVLKGGPLGQFQIDM